MAKLDATPHDSHCCPAIELAPAGLGLSVVVCAEASDAVRTIPAAYVELEFALRGGSLCMEPIVASKLSPLRVRYIAQVRRGDGTSASFSS